MVLAYHVILAFYGFWLPNDGRGAYSSFVWAEHLRRFGAATHVGRSVRHSVAHRRQDYRLRDAARRC